MPENPPNWQLILQAARALTAAGQTPLTRISIYQWIWRRYRARSMTGPAWTPPCRA
jgi:hypothetical protein